MINKSTKIKRRTADRAKDERIYAQRSKEFYEAKKAVKQHRCIFCGEFVEIYAGVHHWLGRENNLLLDEKWWSVVHQECHQAWHDRPISWLSKQWWWSGFLVRAKDFHEDVLRIVERRIEKSKT